jgi:hypothetical protein
MTHEENINVETTPAIHKESVDVEIPSVIWEESVEVIIPQLTRDKYDENGWEEDLKECIHGDGVDSQGLARTSPADQEGLEEGRKQFASHKNQSTSCS